MKWDKINLRYKMNHQNILKVMDLILTLPATSSEVERGFSQMKLIKTNIRSKLSTENLNNLMTIKMLAASIEEFDPIPAIEHWNVAGIRRLQKENNSEDENTSSDDNQDDYVENELNDCLETNFQMD